MASVVHKKIYKKIKQYDTIVVARHTGPDPDAIASQIALRDSIRLTFPHKKVIAVGAGVSRFKRYGILDKSEFDGFKDALLLITDVPTIERVDGIEGLSYKEVIKIDHHPHEDKICELEIVDDTASSACQLIAELLFATPLKMNKTIASTLFLGIVSDSDRFLLAYTTAKTFRVVSRLIEEQNLDFVSLYDILYERPLNEIQFHGYLGNHLNVTESGFAYIKIMPEIIKEYDVDISTPSNMINDFNYIKDVLVWVFVTFDEKNNLYKVNIRSRGPIINEIAEKYHGGGHKFASGVRTSSEEEIDHLLKDLDMCCKEYKEKESA